MRETWVRSLGREDPLEKEMVTHSSILAWRIPWTEKPGRLQSTGSQRVGHDWVTSLIKDICIGYQYKCIHWRILSNYLRQLRKFSLKSKTLVGSCIALSHFSHGRLCAAQQAPPPLGFSRQEYWSGLPFPSPMHESEKCKWSLSHLSPTLCDPVDCSLLGSSVHGIFQTRVLEWVAIAFSLWKTLGCI